MKQLFSKFLVAFLLTSAVVLSWSEYFLLAGSGGSCCILLPYGLFIVQIVGFYHYFEVVITKMDNTTMEEW